VADAVQVDTKAPQLPPHGHGQLSVRRGTKQTSIRTANEQIAERDKLMTGTEDSASMGNKRAQLQ